MIYIKVTDDRELIITKNSPIFRGEKLNQKLIFLVPKTLSDIDVQTSVVDLLYVCPGSGVEIETLTHMDEAYFDYLQFVLPVDLKITEVAGPVLLWLNIHSEDDSIDAKTSKCKLYIDTDSVEDTGSDDGITEVDIDGAVLYNKVQALVESEQQRAQGNIGLDEEDVRRALLAAGMLIEDQG